MAALPAADADAAPLDGALAHAERAVGALLEASRARGGAPRAFASSAADAAALRRVDALAVTLQRARSALAAPDARRAWARGFASLPHTVVAKIFTLLGVEERARAACVQVAWRDALKDGNLWTVLDLSPAGGIPRQRATDALLRGAAAKALGVGLRSLDVSGCSKDLLTESALKEVVKAHGATLRTLRSVSLPDDNPNEHRIFPLHVDVAVLCTLLSATPSLTCAEFTTSGYVADVLLPRFLRCSGRHAALRLHGLSLFGSGTSAASVHNVLHAVAHASVPLRSLYLDCLPLSNELALVALEAACANVAGRVELLECDLPQRGAAAPFLARIAGSSKLTGLHIHNCNRARAPLLDAAGAVLFADALRSNASLASVTLDAAGIFKDAAVATSLLSALTDHPCLRTLVLCTNGPRRETVDVDDALAAAGAALGALAKANAPALTSLDVSYCALGDHLAPLLVALAAHNTHLHTLKCVWNEIFAGGAAAPALLALARSPLSGLRALEAVSDDAAAEADEEGELPAAEARQAEALVDEKRRRANLPPYERQY